MGSGFNLGLKKMLWIYIEAVDSTRISQVALVVKKPPANEGDLRDAALIPGWGRSPGEGNGNPLQCSCLENPTDRGTWQATVHGVARNGHDLAAKPPAPQLSG